MAVRRFIWKLRIFSERRAICTHSLAKRSETRSVGGPVALWKEAEPRAPLTRPPLGFGLFPPVQGLPGTCPAPCAVCRPRWWHRDRPVSRRGPAHHTLYLETFYKKKTQRVLALPRSQDAASNKPQSVKGLCH